MTNIHKSCFISYAHDGIDRDSLDYFVSTLESEIKPNGSVYIDQKVKAGDNFDKFMSLIESVDLIIIILTPQYKQRILHRQGAAYQEFKIIIDRYNSIPYSESNEKEIKKGMQLIPILFSGTRTDSTPEEIRTIKQLDLTALKASRKPNGEFHQANSSMSTCVSIVRVLVNDITTSATLDSQEYRKLTDTYYNGLFVDLKAAWNKADNYGKNYLSTQFIKTITYQLVLGQQAFFLVGRKGSGKSTLTQVLPLLNEDRYRLSININADHYNLETLYSLYRVPQVYSDMKNVFLTTQVFEFAWESTLMLSLTNSLIQISDELQNELESLSSDLQIIRSLVTRISSVFNVNSDIIEFQESDCFYYCFQRVIDFANMCIDDARIDPDLFLVDIKLRFKLENFLRYIFGTDFLLSFRSVLKTIDKKFLITLDGFDTAFDSFRLESIRTYDENQLRNRAIFEADWLRSLLSLTIRAKSNSSNYFYGSLEFCITTPLDRFLEVMRTDRDSYRYLNRCFTLQWSGIELATLVRRRLEGLTTHETSDDFSEQHRLDRILEHKQFKHIPSEIKFNFNGRDYSMPLL